MERGGLRHDLCTIIFLPDYVVMMPKYHGTIPVGNNHRGTGIVQKTYEALNIRAQELYVRGDESLCAGYELKCRV